MEEIEEFIKDEYLEGYDYMNHLYLVATNNFTNIIKVKIIVESHDQGWQVMNIVGHGEKLIF